MSHLSALFLILLFVGCSTPPATVNDDKPSRLDLRNFGPEFQLFMKASEPDPSEAKLIKNWKELVEAKDKSFFQRTVMDADRPAEADYKKTLTEAWPVLQKYKMEIDLEFSKFPELLKENLNSFSKLFPDFDLSKTPVYAVPSLLKFNGRATEAYGPKVLAFGLDTIVYFRHEPGFVTGAKLTSNSKVLYAHEMFHVYHGEKQKLVNAKDDESGTLFNDAWNEGLATYASNLVNPSASDADLLMDSELARHCSIRGAELLTKFKKIGNLRSQSPKGKKLYRTWFLLSSKDKEIPLRAGYCVGLLIAKKIANSGVTISEMASWPFAKIPSQLLQYIAE